MPKQLAYRTVNKVEYCRYVLHLSDGLDRRKKLVSSFQWAKSWIAHAKHLTLSKLQRRMAWLAIRAFD